MVHEFVARVETNFENTFTEKLCKKCNTKISLYVPVHIKVSLHYLVKYFIGHGVHKSTTGLVRVVRYFVEENWEVALRNLYPDTCWAQLALSEKYGQFC